MLFLLACSGFGSPPASPMSPCPDKPNCVSSLATDASHMILPLDLYGDRTTAIARLAALVQSFPRTQIIAQDSAYLHATFASPTMSYIDDVEFRITDGRIQVRSASRFGHGDMGVNRNRVEEIRAQWDSMGGKR